MGKKLKYETPEEMDKAVNAYFQEQERREKLPTMSGLVRVLGFESRSSLRDYNGREKYSHIIKNARKRVEEFYEEALLERDAFRGAQFCLRVNYGWIESKDESQRDTQFVFVNDIPRANLVRNDAGSGSKEDDGDHSASVL